MPLPVSRCAPYCPHNASCAWVSHGRIYRLLVRPDLPRNLSHQRGRPLQRSHPSWQSPQLWQSCVSRGNGCPLRLVPRCGRVIFLVTVPNLAMSHSPMGTTLAKTSSSANEPFVVKLPTPVGHQITLLCTVAVLGDVSLLIKPRLSVKFLP